MAGPDRDRATPVEIRKKGGLELSIRWKDGHESCFEPASLRESCPCARCVDEITGERRHGAGQAPAGLEFRHAEVVGHYALQVEFSDGHGTGLYPFDLLRRLCGCADCRAAAAEPPA